MAKSADARDLKSLGSYLPCGFKSRPRHLSAGTSHAAHAQGRSLRSRRQIPPPALISGYFACCACSGSLASLATANPAPGIFRRVVSPACAGSRVTRFARDGQVPPPAFATGTCSRAQGQPLARPAVYPSPLIFHRVLGCPYDAVEADASRQRPPGLCLLCACCGGWIRTIRTVEGGADNRQALVPMFLGRFGTVRTGGGGLGIPACPCRLAICGPLVSARAPSQNSCRTARSPMVRRPPGKEAVTWPAS